MSNGEYRMAKILDDLCVEYEREYTFLGCKDERLLPFDFYLPEYNTCIEIQGKQHYKSVDFFGGEEGFKKRKNTTK